MKSIGVALLLVVSACASSPLESTSESSSFESFGLLTADAICSLSYVCCTADERRERDLPKSEPECRTRIAADLNEEFTPAISAGVAAGRVRYESARYERCLSRVVSAGCGTARSYVDCLDEGFVPLVPAGGACDAQVHCIDSVCIGMSADAPGDCGEPLPVGAACAENLECVDEACVMGVCRERGNEGRACFDDSECQSEHCDDLAHVCVPPGRAFCD